MNRNTESQIHRQTYIKQTHTLDKQTDTNRKTLEIQTDIKQPPILDRHGKPTDKWTNNQTCLPIK